jgi:hypothetical protein
MHPRAALLTAALRVSPDRAELSGCLSRKDHAWLTSRSMSSKRYL